MPSGSSARGLTGSGSSISFGATVKTHLDNCDRRASVNQENECAGAFWGRKLGGQIGLAKTHRLVVFFGVNCRLWFGDRRLPGDLMRSVVLLVASVTDGHECLSLLGLAHPLWSIAWRPAESLGTSQKSQVDFNAHWQRRSGGNGGRQRRLIPIQSQLGQTFANCGCPTHSTLRNPQPPSAACHPG